MEQGLGAKILSWRTGRGFLLRRQVQLNIAAFAVTEIARPAAIGAIDEHVAHARGAHVAECDLGLAGQHDIPELKSGHCTSGQCASGQLSLDLVLELK
jgi:hypothetical protein